MNPGIFTLFRVLSGRSNIFPGDDAGTTGRQQPRPIQGSPPVAVSIFARAFPQVHWGPRAKQAPSGLTPPPETNEVPVDRSQRMLAAISFGCVGLFTGWTIHARSIDVFPEPPSGPERS